MKRTVGEAMTNIPVRLEETASLETARRMIERYNVRHLPVTRDGRLVGVLSQRELNVALAISRSHLLEATVLSVMQEPAFQVAPGVPVADVAERMAREKLGCAVVVNGETIVGIFTTTDALKLLVEEYRKQEKRT